MKPFVLFLLVCANVSPCLAQGTGQPLNEAIQLGTRIVRSAGADALQLRLMIPPELMIYAGSKLAIQMGLPSTQQFAQPSPTRVQMIDGSTHLVHAGAVTLNALYPVGFFGCGRAYNGRLLVQGCTTRICFAPEAIPFRALSNAC